LLWRRYQHLCASAILLLIGAGITFSAVLAPAAAVLLGASVVFLAFFLFCVQFSPNEKPRFVWECPWSAACVGLLCHWTELPLDDAELGAQLRTHYDANKKKNAKLSRDEIVEQLMDLGVALCRKRVADKQLASPESKCDAAEPDGSEKK
jgi:hypothetical protein